MNDFICVRDSTAAENLRQEYVSTSVNIESFIGIESKQDAFASAMFRLNQIVENLIVLEGSSKSELIVGLNFRVREILALRQMFSH